MPKFEIVTEKDRRDRLLQMKKSRHVIEGMELIDVMVADMDRDKKRQEEQKNTRRPGRMSLRSRLVSLLTLIVTQRAPARKGVSPDG